MTDPELLVVHNKLTHLKDIESGLVYMHSIRIPTDHDLQNYPNVFFTSPDIWDASVLDHEITQSLLEDINQHSDDSLLQYSISDEYGDLHHWAIQTLQSSVTYLLYLLGSPSPVLTCMTAIMLKRIGKPSDPILAGNLSKSSRIPTRSPQDLEAPFHNMITSRSTSSPGILFSTSPGEPSLLPRTPSSVTHQPSWPNSLLDETLWYVIPMASKLKNNS